MKLRKKEEEGGRWILKKIGKTSSSTILYILLLLRNETAAQESLSIDQILQRLHQHHKQRLFISFTFLFNFQESENYSLTVTTDVKVGYAGHTVLALFNESQTAMMSFDNQIWNGYFVLLLGNCESVVSS